MIGEQTRAALATGGTIDITTTGRRSGRPRRIEIAFHNLGGRIYVTGLPGRRGWYANLLAQPEFTFHLRHGAPADLRARAHPVADPLEREHVLRQILERIDRSEALDAWVGRAPLVEVEFPDLDR